MKVKEIKIKEIQLTMSINFISAKPDSDETRTMRTKSNNAEIIMASETDEIIEELFESYLERYQEGLEESMRGSEFIFDSVDKFKQRRIMYRFS